MCFTTDKIEHACGFLFLNESNVFVYCCKSCHNQYESGVELESHILLEHQEHDTASTFIDESEFDVEHVIINEADNGEDEVKSEQDPQSNQIEIPEEHYEDSVDSVEPSILNGSLNEENSFEIEAGNSIEIVKIEAEDEYNNYEQFEENLGDESNDSDDESLANLSQQKYFVDKRQKLDDDNESTSNTGTVSTEKGGQPKVSKNRGRKKGNCLSASEEEIEEKVLFRAKKRICRPQLHEKSFGKDKVERGVEYESQSGKVKKGKVFVPRTTCKCKSKQCSTKIDFARQKELFDSFHQNSDSRRKTLFIRASVKATPVPSKKSTLFPKSRGINCSYRLIDNDGITRDVCRDFYCNFLQVDTKRVYRALHSATKNPTGADNRGKKNNSTEQNKKIIREFIDQFPKYESHYGRMQTKPKYLGPTLYVKRLYHEFKRVMESRNVKGVKIPRENTFRSVFRTEFNLSFKKRHTDTCKTCDEINANLQNTITSTAKKSKLKKEKEEHLSLVERTDASFCDDIKAAAESNRKITILTFKLQRTLETPSLSTSQVLYKRQLWTYNLCIFDEIEKKGYMYFWSENIASRGEQEVGSCLLKHLNNHISRKTSKIILNSDLCGGQNRNIKVTLFLKKFLSKNSNVKRIEQKFFVSGHSNNNCDRCFSMIDKHKRSVGDVYTPSDWQQLIAESKANEPKFHLTVMLPNDFLSSNELEKLIVNRKIDEQNLKINWHGFRQIRYLKNDLFHIIAEENGVWKSINIQKKGVDESTFCETQMECLYPDGNEINQMKYDDLMDLLQHIPHEYHSFYLNLKHNDDAVDFGLASEASDDSDDDDIIFVEEE